ncbi:ABC transporter substrate-binding protein [Ilumatobacter nonamiensis]|uniref:ABC transporter substrate-binding protein n=1 Tax=Ilumatobacter nonamiensis TaxID=467093 RepID=UPI000A00D65A|nr:ABC transporter substrate-binding protein [Ilumatobacter nonamiensis]
MTRRVRIVAATLVAGAMIASACAGGDDDAGTDTGTDSGADEESADTTVDTDDTGGESTDDTGDESGDDAIEGDGEMTPQRGGTLTYLLEAETDTWDTPNGNCAVACITVMRNVSDTLTIVNEDNQVEPFVLETFEPNEDFTEFNMTMRDGVTFHDGTPADGAALQRHLIAQATGVLRGQWFLDLANGPAIGDPAAAEESIVLNDDDSVTVSFSRPTATFGYSIADRDGFLQSPTFWDLPDEERRGALPIGTGPFVMEEWNRGEQTTLVANENYWRTDSEGETLPYLDGINFRPVPDAGDRQAIMQSGDADLNQDSQSVTVEFWQNDWVDEGGQLARAFPAQETTYLMLNNSQPPFDDPEVRRALAHCTDREEYLTFRAQGNVLAEGPFAEGAPGYLEDSGFPEFDPDEGNRIFDEIGRPEVIEYGTTNVLANLETAALFQDQWSTNCDLNVAIDQFEQTELITKALGGDFQLVSWRNHGQGNPGLELEQWHSRHTEGSPAINFGRITNDTIDELLLEVRATTDADEVDRIGQEINAEFADQVHNIWLNHTIWSNAYPDDVHGVQEMSLESGNTVRGAVGGRVWIQEAWKEQE